jgi:hypothetical protein
MLLFMSSAAVADVCVSGALLAIACAALLQG